MNGLVLADRRRVEFRTDLPEPAPRDPGDALVAVGLAGVCGSDLHPYEGREPVRWGIVPGHEAAGVVLEVGSDVRRFRAGHRVSLPFSTSCGACGACRAGLSARCVRGRLFGWAPPGAGPDVGLEGTQVERVRVPFADGTLIRLEPEDTFEMGVLLGDNFATGFFAATSAEVGAGTRVAVIGCGAVGLSALVVARHLGAGPVLAIDPVGVRRDAAGRLGADAAADPADLDTVSREAASMGAVLEAVGSREARRLAVELAAPGAVIVSVGVANDDFGFPPSVLYDRNLTWRSGRCPARSLQPAIRRARSRGLDLPVDALVSGAPRPLREGPAVYREFAARTAGAGKPLLVP